MCWWPEQYDFCHKWACMLGDLIGTHASSVVNKQQAQTVQLDFTAREVEEQLFHWFVPITVAEQGFLLAAKNGVMISECKRTVCGMHGDFPRSRAEGGCYPCTWATCCSRNWRTSLWRVFFFKQQRTSSWLQTVRPLSLLKQHHMDRWMKLQR